MKEIKEIIKAYDAAQTEGKQTALATVVHLQGSAYRRPGARMLVTIDGKLTGAISGGCLEGDALRKAQLVMVQKNPMLVTYDTTDDDDTTLGVGLGCNGIISILIEPIDADEEHNPIQFLKQYASTRQAAVIVTLFSLDKRAVQPGTCLLVTKSTSQAAAGINNEIASLLLKDALPVLHNRKSAFKHYESQQPLTGFIEFLDIPVSLLIFGAGNDCMPLVEMAHILGWETTVVDGRANYATRERFPSVNKLFVAKTSDIINKVEVDKRTVAALMTHNYNYDLATLQQLLVLPTPYIGVLGPKKKMDRMLEELREQGMNPSDEQLAVIHGPSGLDLGSETAEEIALSIIAEIQAVLSKRQATPLREKSASIHAEEAAAKS